LGITGNYGASQGIMGITGHTWPSQAIIEHHWALTGITGLYWASQALWASWHDTCIGHYEASGGSWCMGHCRALWSITGHHWALFDRETSQGIVIHPWHCKGIVGHGVIPCNEYSLYY